MMDREMMLPTTTRAHSVAWTEPRAHEEHAAATWVRTSNNNDVVSDLKNDDIATMGGGGDGTVPSFKTMLEAEWYNSAMNRPNENFMMQPLDSSSNAPPPFILDPSPHHSQSFSPFFNGNNNPFENTFDLVPDGGFLTPFRGSQSSNSPILMGFQPHIDTLELSSNHEFLPPTTQLSGGFRRIGVEQAAFNCSGSSNAMFSNDVKPHETRPPAGASSTLFQKRSMLQQGSGGSTSGVDKLGALDISAPQRLSGFPLEQLEERDEGELQEGLNYDSDDEFVEICNNNSGGGNQMGKKKGMPAKNLMAERRRRKKLNDRLYMLRSVVPKISKMDRASILGDAIDYTKELLQRVHDLKKELESSPTALSPSLSASFHPLTPTPPTLPCQVKEELCPSSSPSPKNQSAKVEVRAREGGAVNIHMFCARRPGLLLSTMRALDNLGLDVQQAVISCFNGFALDVFRAEQCSEDQDVLPEQIKAVLLQVADFPGMM